MSKKLKSTPITLEDVIFIFNDDQNTVHAIFSSCLCRQCDNGYSSKITNYTISLNSLNDIEINGFCDECNTKMGRYLETGENPDTAENAAAVWDTNSTLKELKIKKTK